MGQQTGSTQAAREELQISANPLPVASSERAVEAKPTKLLVFAFIPPPHHGQSWMVLQLLKGFGGDHRKSASTPATAPYGIECYHVNSRLTRDVSEIGSFAGGKALKVFRYVAEAIYCRFRYGVKNLYYVPGPPNLLMPLVRDWVILALCRPFFSRTIFYWHAAGLGEWTETKASPFKRWLTRKLLHGAALSMSPSTYNLADSRIFEPRQAKTVAYGIPDPAPDYHVVVESHRRERRGDIVSALQNPATECRIGVFFLALCAREKGLHEAVEGVAIANRRMREQGSGIRFHLEVGGSFLNDDERRMFDDLVRRLGTESEVTYIGFVNAEQKAAAFKRSDIFCFPTYYSAESFGIVVIEAMAFGCPVVTTRWRSMPEFFDPNYPGLVDIKAPDQVASALVEVLKRDYASAFRRKFVENYILETHLKNMAAAIKAVAT